jgi:hypothetical protein
MQLGALLCGEEALYQASKLLEGVLPNLVSGRYESIGVKMLANALKMPIKILI